MQQEKSVDLIQEKFLVSLSKILYTYLCWTAVACLSSVTLEVGARSPLGHSVTKSAAFNAIFRRNYNTKIHMQMGNFVASILSVFLIIMARRLKNPYLYLPWVVNSMKGIFLYEAPAFFNFMKNQMPYAPFATSIFALAAIILFVEELCIWWDACLSFIETWKEYVHHTGKGDQIGTQLRNAAKTIRTENSEEEVAKSIEKEELVRNLEKPHRMPSTPRLTQSLTHVEKIS